MIETLKLGVKMSTLEDIKSKALADNDRSYSERMNRIRDAIDRYGHVFMWVQEKIDPDRIIVNGFDTIGWPEITLIAENVDHAKSIINRIVMECGLRIVDRPDFKNLHSTDLNWAMKVDDAASYLYVKISPKHCRLEDTGEVKITPVRKLVCG